MAASMLRVGVTRRRRAVVAVQVAVVLAMIVGMTALTIDLGTLYTATSELQTAADSAALAATSGLTSDAMMLVRLDPDDTVSFSEVTGLVATRGNQLANLNETLGSPTLIQTGDITTGALGLLTLSGTLNTAAAINTVNAVRVEVRRDESVNGPVEFFFAPIFGRLSGTANASAIAVFDDRVSGYIVTPNGTGVMPFTVDETIFSTDLASGGDLYSYDTDTDTVASGSDGIGEINLYPHTAAPGNYGLLNINNPNAGVPALRDDIDNGVAPEDFEGEIGTSDLTFYGVDGNPITYTISGNPGMKATLESNVLNRVGDVIAFFLHDQVSGNGNNTTYQITQIRFGRIMDADLPQNGIWIQPVSFAGSAVRTSASAPSSGGLAGRIVLAR